MHVLGLRTGQVIDLADVRLRIGEQRDDHTCKGCKWLIKNCITCWNYLYLAQKLAETDDLESREALRQAVANGSVVSWQHINLLGEYDFSEEKLRDSVGIKPSKLAA